MIIMVIIIIILTMIVYYIKSCTEVIVSDIPLVMIFIMISVLLKTHLNSKRCREKSRNESVISDQWSLGPFDELLAKIAGDLQSEVGRRL